MSPDIPIFYLLSSYTLTMKTITPKMDYYTQNGEFRIHDKLLSFFP